MKRFLVAAFVENKHGVLARISGMFLRKGFNIDTIASGETEDPNFSRITISMKGEDYHCEQLILQLKKIFNVKQVKLLEKENAVERELMLVKVKNTPEIRNEILAAAEIYRAKIIDYTTDAMCVEVTGEPSKINAFIEVMRPLGIIEMCRTGVVSLERGASIMEK